MAESEPESLIDNAYMQEHYLRVYFEDAIAQLLAHRQEGNKNPAMKPVKFFKEYFTSVHQGTHVLFREFSFVSATPYNRLCVLKAFMQIYKPLFFRDKKYNARDYHSILQLVIPDFRMQVVQDAFTAYDDDKKDEENCLSFSDFVKALKASFCTGEFDFEANLLKAQVEAKIAELSYVPSQSETSVNLSESDFFFNIDEEFTRRCAAATRMSVTDLRSAADRFELSEIRRALYECEFPSGEDDTTSGEKPSTSTSGSRDTSKSERSKKKNKKKEKGKSKGKSKDKKSTETKAKKSTETKAKKSTVTKDKKSTEKPEEKSGTAKLNRGRLPTKRGLSTSLNVLQRGKSEDAQGVKPKIKVRQRSKSASGQHRSRSETAKPVKPIWR